MTYKVLLTYFRQTGRFLATAETTINRSAMSEIWLEIDAMRRLGQLPGLRSGAGRDLLIVIDVPDHPQRVPHMVMPPFVDEDDITPPRMPTGEMIPLMRVPLEEIPRTSTRDIVKIGSEEIGPDDITPVDQPIPKMPDEK